MLALTLALVTLGVAATAPLLAARLRPNERALVAGAAVLFAVTALLSPEAAVNDQWTHFVHLRDALADPVRLLDPWDRPGFTLVYAAPAGLGLDAARLTSAAVAALGMVATVRAARALRLARPWVPALLLAVQHDFFGQASSTMTELPFAAGLAVAIWGWAERRPWVVAAGLGWCGVTRPEGVLFAVAGAAALLARHRRPGPAVLALAPLAAWAAAGAVAFGDPLWWLHRNAYGGMVAPRVELRQLAESWFYEALRRGQPPVLVVLEIAGAVVAAGPARRLRFLLAPVAASFLVLTFARIGLTDAWRESRYLVAIAPALALLAAAGLEAALSAFPRAAPPALLGLAAAGAAREILWTWRGVALAIPYAWPLVYATALAAAAVLWKARRRLPPRAALGLLLIMPLACSPPGSYGKQRPDAAPTHGTRMGPPLGVPSPACDVTPQRRCSSSSE
ncbi:MAG TPA: hypothetical protein VFL83_09255 [Anaeromyxobacter sp.]|nr:hypothetical protein [Anaeromyxobacter sp.]